MHTRDAARDGGREGKIFLRGAKRVKKKIKPGSVEVYRERDRGFEPKKTSTRLASVCLSRDRARFRLLHFGATSVLFFSSRRSSSCLFGTPKISLFFRSLLSCPSVSQAAFALTQILGGGGARRAEGGGGRVGENLRTSTPFPPLFFTRSSTAKKCFCQIERGERAGGAPSLL